MVAGAVIGDASLYHPAMDALSDGALSALAEQVGDGLMRRGERLATAESCTGGWIGKVCTDVAGSSRWYVGGVVGYSNALKSALLGVSSALLSAQGAVSESVAIAMARGGLTFEGATRSVAVTGVAGPDGGTAAKPVGTVWIGYADRRDQFAQSFLFEGDRDRIRRWTVREALGLAAR